MDRLRLRSEGGFTLIELLVVIAIIGILAAIAIPQFAAYRRRGYDSQIKSDIRNLATAQEAYFVDNNSYATGAGNTSKFTTRGFRQSGSVTITAEGTGSAFTITGTVNPTTLCPTSGTGTFTFSSSTGTISGSNCS